MFIYLTVIYAFDELHLVRQLCLNLANRSWLIALARLGFGSKLFNIVDEFISFSRTSKFARSTLRQTQQRARR